VLFEVTQHDLLGAGGFF